MAEQSIGMATGTGAAYGDGNVGSGYASSRMTAMETKTLSDGVLQVGGKLAMTGVGTGTLTIADGAAVVAGYFYENTSSAGIVISSLANATYNVVILLNNTAGSITVSRSVAGTVSPWQPLRNSSVKPTSPSERSKYPAPSLLRLASCTTMRCTEQPRSYLTKHTRQ